MHSSLWKLTSLEQQDFKEDPFRVTCVKSLETMQKLATAVIHLDENDHTLQKRYENYKMQWEKLLSIIDKNTSSEEKQNAERSEDYNQKYVLFCDIHLLTGSAFRSCNVFYYVVSF